MDIISENNFNNELSYISDQSEIIRENADPLFQYNGQENLGFNFLQQNWKQNAQLKAYLSYCYSISPVIPSCYGEYFLSNLYRDDIMIDRLINYHLNKCFTNLKVSFEDSVEEEKNGISKNIDFLNKKIQKYNKIILEVFLLSEKYGGSYITRLDDGRIKAYNRFDKTNIESRASLQEKINNKQIVFFKSSMIPETSQQRNLCKGWNYAWIDKHLRQYLYVRQIESMIPEQASKQQIITFTSPHNNNRNYFSEGYDEDIVLNKISKTSNNSCVGLKDDEKLELLTSNINLKNVQEIYIQQLSLLGSVPKSFLDEEAAHNALTSHSQDNLGVQSSLDESERIYKHYYDDLQNILQFIIKNELNDDEEKIIDELEKQYGKIQLIKDNTPSYNEDKKLEMENLRVDIELKKAQIEESKKRFQYEDEVMDHEDK